MSDLPPGPLLPKAQLIADNVRRRIINREWQQGERIPDEADLAIEFDVARATVNKALQLLADEGLLDRRRRAGTRVSVNPALRATVTIPIVREQIESAGMDYSHRVIAQRRSPIPANIAQRLKMPVGAVLTHLRAVHYGNGRPFQFEDRWINPASVPDLDRVDFRHLNANEWLVRNAPYLHADLSFSAENADARDARLLEVRKGQALLTMHRTTWDHTGAITTVRIACHAGYVMNAMN